MQSTDAAMLTKVARVKVNEAIGYAYCLLLCRVRVSLGLKPLSMENSADTKRKEFDARQKVLAEQEQDAQAAALAERVQK